ncbi:hypothetical protein MVEN_02039600 [Mycena venus]|uniref:Uncharacterized protein n=1 Tax=Mycena venus TaxID=2733690 RepID=A0A8H6XBC7_9AGAR|nr:hypothetical protein MVEN_02039600 [Mycena venus]
MSYPNPYSPTKGPQAPPSYRDAMYVPSRNVVGPEALAKRYKPFTLRNWVVAVVVISLFGLAVAIEVALAISTKNDGFPTPQRNVFTGVSPRFLTAFIPTLLVAGLVLVWQSSDRSYRELQPYIVLARGNVTAAEGLLANYSGLSVWGVITNALKFRHYLILLSTVTTLLGAFLQPLAGSVIQLEQRPQTNNGIFINSTKTIGLIPDVLDLNAFLAAAGFAEASVVHGLPDPPFIRDGWAIAEFERYKPQQTAIPPQSFSLSTPGTANFTITATNSAGCTANTTFDPQSTSSSTQYGAVAVQNCTSDETQFQPIMFWYFARRADDIGTPQGASVFCNPSIKAFNVMTKTDLNNASIIDVTTLDPVTTSNNVTGGSAKRTSVQQVGLVKFGPSNDSFVQARATSISAGVSGAIFRFAAQQSGGVQATFDEPDPFLNITRKIFTQHLSISAKSIYFVNAPSTVPASIVSLVPRLVIDEIPAHALSVVLVLIGFSALFIHILHSRQRRRFFLAAAPGSIAHIISMTAHARFGEKLYPYDDDETLARKLAGLSFGLDPRTGAVVADRNVGQVTAPAGSVTPYNVPDLRPHPSMSALSESTDTLAGTYSDEGKGKAQASRSSSPMFSEKYAARSMDGSYASSEGPSTPGPSRRSFGELDLEGMPGHGQQLPSYADDLESQSSRGLVPPLVVEKRGRIDTSSGRSRGSLRTTNVQSQGESLPLLGD